MIEVTVGRSSQLEGAEANVVESFIVNTEGFIGVLHQLMNGQSGIVRFDYSVRDFGGRDDGVGVHDSVGILFADLGDEQGAHAGSSATSQRMGQLESLKTVAGLSFFANHIQDGIDQFSTWKRQSN